MKTNRGNTCIVARSLWQAWSGGIVLCAAVTLHAQPGGLDPTFQLAGNVSVFALQADGNTLASGDFATGGTPRRLVRLNTDGRIDSTFTTAGPDGGVTYLL